MSDPREIEAWAVMDGDEIFANINTRLNIFLDDGWAIRTYGDDVKLKKIRITIILDEKNARRES